MDYGTTTNININHDFHRRPMVQTGVQNFPAGMPNFPTQESTIRSAECQSQVPAVNSNDIQKLIENMQLQINSLDDSGILGSHNSKTMSENFLNETFSKK